MSTPERAILFVGTFPAETREQAMETMVGLAGPSIRQITDGEIPRLTWIEKPARELAQNPAVRVIRPGGFTGSFDIPLYTLRRGQTIDPDSLHLGYAERALDSWSDFTKVRGEKALDFQVGIPSDAQLPFLAFKFAGFDERHRAPFRTATQNEVRTIYKEHGKDVVFQLEVPVDTALINMTPPLARPFVARRLARGIGRFMEDLPVDARFGLHLCVGDLQNKPMTRLRSTKPLALFANMIAEEWPDGHKVPEYMHLPLSDGEHVPTLDEGFYKALGTIALHQDTRIVAGFIHENMSVLGHQVVLNSIEDQVGHPVDVAAACGLGRRSLERAIANTQTAVQLLERVQGTPDAA